MSVFAWDEVFTSLFATALLGECSQHNRNSLTSPGDQETGLLVHALVVCAVPSGSLLGKIRALSGKLIYFSVDSKMRSPAFMTISVGQVYNSGQVLRHTTVSTQMEHVTNDMFLNMRFTYYEYGSRPT
jgi:hypothetical protein